MMEKNIILDDHEDGCSIQVSVDSDFSGVVVYCTDHAGIEVEISVDARLFKKLCNEVSKTIKSRASKANWCGEVTYA
jgi:hypothetical protein